MAIQKIPKLKQSQRNKHHIFTKAEENFIFENYLTYAESQFYQIFNKQFNVNVTEDQIRSFRLSKGWRKTKPKTLNYDKLIPIGTERIHGNSVEIKVAQPHTYILKSRYVWEKAFGPIPIGYIICFKDGNNKNFDLSNLECVPRKGTCVKEHPETPSYIEKYGCNFRLKNTHRIVSDKSDLRSCKRHRNYNRHPSTYYKIGAEKLSPDGYIKVKIANPDTWVYKHHLIYRENIGEIPPNYVIRFKDGNKKNFDLSNLELIRCKYKLYEERVHNGYTEILIEEPSTWKLKQRWLWEQEHGEIPAGYKIIFLDGDSSNFDIKNLVAVPSAISMFMNMYNLRSTNPEVTKTGILTAELLNKITDIKKKRKK